MVWNLSPDTKLKGIQALATALHTEKPQIARQFRLSEKGATT